MRGRSFFSKELRGFIEFFEDLDAVPMEAQAFRCEPQRPRRSHEQEHTQIGLQSLDRPADDSRINQERPGRANEAVGLDGPHKDVHLGDIPAHANVPNAQMIIDVYALL
jgi:hypothetical protein